MKQLMNLHLIRKLRLSIHKRFFMFVTFIAFVASTSSYANWYQDIINAITKQGMISNGWLSSINNQQQVLLDSQRAMEKLMSQVNDHLMGHSGWGNYQFHDYQSYGSSAINWNDVMRMAGQGQGDGALGAVIKELSQQFPADKSSFNTAVHHKQTQQYYALQSQTILAARAASQLDYNKIQDQIAYQQMLQQQIEKAKDLKSAMDLSNRIQVEGNLINLEILRQAALSNQQQALTGEGGLIGSLANAKFLTKK